MPPLCLARHCASGQKQNVATNLVQKNSPPRFLFRGVMRFIGKHPLLGSLTPTPFLPAKLFDPRPLSIDSPFLSRFDFIEQQPPRDKSVETLLPRALAFDLQP